MMAGHCVTKTTEQALKTGRKNVGVNTSGGHPAMDYSEHNKTYSGFIRFTKVAIVLLVLLLAGMKYFLV